MITVSKGEHGYVVIGGHMRLAVQLRSGATVVAFDMKAKKNVFLHDVGGRLLAVSAEDQEKLHDAAVSIIDRARSSSRKP